MDFLVATTDNALAAMCPGTSAGDFQNSFAIRFTGFFNASTAGSYTGYFSTDDGTRLSVNGTQIYDSYGIQGSGPGNETLSLSAGANPFQLDYFASDYGGTNAAVTLQDGLTWSPSQVTTTPEPSSAALLVTGLAGIIPIARRRRRR